MTQVLLSTISAGALAFLGSWFGLRHALERFKRERSFELQVDWYREAAAALHRAARMMNQAATAVEVGVADDDRRRYVDRQQDALGEAVQLAAEGRIFAGKRAASAFRRLISSVDVAALRRQQGTDAELVALWKQLSPLYTDAALELSAEARGLMGLEPLPDPRS